MNTSYSEFGLIVNIPLDTNLEGSKLREIGVKFSISLCVLPSETDDVCLIKVFSQLWACRTIISNPYLELYL